MDKKIIVILGLGLILALSIIWWFSAPKGCPGANGGDSCGYYGSTNYCNPLPPTLQSIRLQYDGTFTSDFLNGFSAEEIILEDIDIIYEGECHNNGEKGSSCIIKQPEIGSNIPKGEVFQVVAQCPSPKKDAKQAFIYFILRYKATKDGEEITETSECGICLKDDGDKFK